MSIEVVNETDVAIDVDALEAQARFTLGRLRIHPQADLSVVLIDEAAMTDLHVKWMDEPGPTDVMSFPMDELRPTKDDEEPEEGLLGDVVICPQVAAKQAETAGHRLEDEVALLLTHGILHLLGYDHAEPEEHAEMFGLQARLLAEWVAFAAAQAEKAGHSLGQELALLTVHGVLHLLGYDHAEPDEEKEMFALQRRLLEEWVADQVESYRQDLQNEKDRRLLDKSRYFDQQ